MNDETDDSLPVDELSKEDEEKLFKELEMSPEEIRAYQEGKTRESSGSSMTLEEARAQFAAWPKRKYPLRTIAEEEAEEARLAEEARKKEE